MSDPNTTPPVPPVPPVPPRPQYGEYAPPGYVSPVPAEPMTPVGERPAYGDSSYAQRSSGAKKRRTWDLVLTLILFVLGLFGMLFGVFYGILFTDAGLIDQAFQQQGLGGFDGDVGAAPTVLVVSHIVLYLLALGAGIPLLLKRRVAFWAPLAAGVIAAIFFWGSIIAVVASDPSLMNQMS